MFLGALTEPKAELLSEQATRSISNVLTRSQSNNITIRAELIEDLVKRVGDRDAIDFDLRYTIADTDYSTILQNALPGLAEAFSDDRSRQQRLLMCVDLIAREHTLSGVDVAVAEFAESRDKRVVKQAVDVLVDMKSKLAVPYLLLRFDTEEQMKLHYVINDVVEIEAMEAIPNIIKLLDYPGENTCHKAVWALFHLDARDQEDVIYQKCVLNREYESSGVSAYILAVLAKWGDVRVFPAIMLRISKKDGRSQMLNRLADLQAIPIEDSVIDFLKAEQADERDPAANLNVLADAMRLLGRLKSKKAIPVLRIMLHDPNSFLSEIAIEQLGILEAEESVPDLVSMLDTEFSWRVTLALARIGSPIAVARVIQEIGERPMNYNGILALEALGKVSAPKTYRMLESKKLDRLETLAVPDYFKQVARMACIEVKLGKTVRQEYGQRKVVGQTGHTALSALHHGVRTLNYSGPSHGIFIEKNCVHILTIEEAIARWNLWLEHNSVDENR